MNLASGPLDSVGDRGQLSDELVARHLTYHEVRHVGSRNAKAPPGNALDHHPISTCAWTVREDDRSDCDPVEIPRPELFEHRAMLPIHPGQVGAGQSQTQAAHDGSPGPKKPPRGPQPHPA